MSGIVEIILLLRWWLTLCIGEEVAQRFLNPGSGKSWEVDPWQV